MSRIQFGVQADPDAVAIRFAVDGVLQSTANAASATFDWDIDSGEHHVPDGTYIVSVTALDQEGVPGPTRSRTIRLNRDIPARRRTSSAASTRASEFTDAPDIVEIIWARNTEPDVTGYRVYREAGATDVLVCDYTTTPTKTECRDMSPPGSADRLLRRRARRGPVHGRRSRGRPVGSADRGQANTQPNQPLTLTATQDGDDVVLTWPDALPVLPPYSGSDVIFYRVYSDGTQIGDRIARTRAGVADRVPRQREASGGHEYYVTAVDENFSESKPLGPVSLP